MKSYVFTLTEEAYKSQDRFVPIIEQALNALGCVNFQNHNEVGCITADFPGEQSFGPIEGIESVEESVDCTTQSESVDSMLQAFTE